MRPFDRHVPPAERVLSVVLLALLPVFAIIIYVKGQHVDPNLFALDPALLATRAGERARYPMASTLPAEAAAPDSVPPSVTDAPGLHRHAPGSETTAVVLPEHIGDGWTADGPAENFSAETLYQKIDGRADEYLHHGARGLQAASYGRNDSFIDVFVYDMGTAEQAATMLAAEQPPVTSSVALGQGGYRAAASYFFTLDRYYVQVIASETGAAIDAAGLALARRVEAAIRKP